MNDLCGMGTGILGDLYFCNKGKGPCRNIIRNKYKQQIVNCLDRKKSLIRLSSKKRCPPSYKDCKNLGVNLYPYPNPKYSQKKNFIL